MMKTVAIFATFIIATLCLVSLGQAQSAPQYPWRPLNGSYHPDDPLLGTPNTPMWRGSIPYNYSDGIGEMRTDLPNPRTISNKLFSIKPAYPYSHTGKNQIHTAMGMTLMHDIGRGLRPANGIRADVPFPKDDIFNPLGNNSWKQPFTRCNVSEGTGVGDKPRVPLAANTPFLDFQSLYGINEAMLAPFRDTSSKGKLKVKHDPVFGDLLPVNEATKQQWAGQLVGNLFPAQDAITTVFLRLHNDMADKYAAQYPDATDEEIFQLARRWVIAIYQSIAFNEYFTATAGEPMPPYKGYNSSIETRVIAPFFSAVVRYGHSELQGVIPRKDKNLKTIPQGDVILRDIMRKPWLYLDQGIEPIIYGAYTELQGEVDHYYEDDLRNYALGIPQNPVSPAQDLGVASIQRNRDLGFPSYNDMREIFGLERKEDFADVHPDPAVQKALEELYGDVDNIEFYVGAITEAHPGKHLGELFTTIFTQQFINIRDGDRFYYKNPEMNFTQDEIQEIDQTTLTKLILKYTNIESLPCSSFYVSTDFACTEGGITPEPAPAAEGVVSLLNGNYILRWNFSSPTSNINDTIITFNITAKTTGWVGLGIAKTPGSMLGSDVIAGWVDDATGQVYINNYSPNARMPCTNGVGVCLVNNTKILNPSGWQSAEGVTSIAFSRPVHSEASFSVITADEYVPIVYAFGPRDGDKTNLNLMYHIGNKAAGAVVFMPTTDAPNNPNVPGDSSSEPRCPPTDDNEGLLSAASSLSSQIILALVAVAASTACFAFFF
eukprot:GEZU01025543.1.p1 GENE.GEZU01025543.1~~GEZU01025543.1.p1  ORF type:complete len:774 (-),score=287.15 GEZU01025543.1:30-2351(-)